MNLTQLQTTIASTITEHPIVAAARQGLITQAQYVAYLSDVYSYALHSAQVISHAGARLALSHPVLASYLFTHAAEELGHHEWAAADLRDLGISQTQIRGIQPSTPCRQMIALEYYQACHANPVGLFGWMYVLETLGGRMGGQIAESIDAGLQLGGKGVYFLAGHGKADEHHAHELTSVIERGVVDADDQRDFQRMGQDSLRLYYEILTNAYRVMSTDGMRSLHKEGLTHGHLESAG